MDSPVIIITLTIGLLVVAGLILAVVAWKKRKELSAEQTDYRAFFIMGIVLTSLGVVGEVAVALLTDIPLVVAFPLVTIGIVYMALGLANRAKWKR